MRRDGPTPARRPPARADCARVAAPAQARAVGCGWTPPHVRAEVVFVRFATARCGGCSTSQPGPTISRVGRKMRNLFLVLRLDASWARGQARQRLDVPGHGRGPARREAGAGSSRSHRRTPSTTPSNYIVCFRPNGRRAERRRDDADEPGPLAVPCGRQGPVGGLAGRRSPRRRLIRVPRRGGSDR